MSKAQNKRRKVPDDYKLQRLYRKKAKLKRKQTKNILEFLFGLTIFALVQLIIIGIFLFAFKATRVVAIENTHQITVKADRVEYRTLARTGKKASNNKLFIVCDSEDYLYADILFYHYDGDDLDEDLRTQTLTLTLENDTKRVVDLRGEKTIFYTLDDYNKTARIRIIMGITLLVVIELVYTTVLFIFLRYFTDFSWRNIKKINSKISKIESDKSGDSSLIGK